MICERSFTVGDLAHALALRFPSAWAEEWDFVGLVHGDPAVSLTGVLVTLDATSEAVERAKRVDANVLVTHHPPCLGPPERIVAGPGPDGAVEAAVRTGIAILSLHTNLDRAPEGARALPTALELDIVEPLESSTEPVVVVTTYAPADAVAGLRAAMARAGAGRLGEYDGCAFAIEGTGHFDPRAGARPVVEGSVGGVAEVRLEMIAPPSRTDVVLEAARAAHPYEEPVVVAVPGKRARGAARLGRLCTWRDGGTLGELAGHVSGRLGVACRVWGDATRPATRIAVVNGSASSLLAEALASADTLIAGEVRYHDALAASAAGLAIIEAGHDATEWPIVRVLADAVREIVGGEVPVTEESPVCGWWTMEAPDV